MAALCDQTPSQALAQIDTRINAAMAYCSIAGFSMLFVATVTTTDWPLHQRFYLIGIDCLLFLFVLFFSRVFGAFGSQ